MGEQGKDQDTRIGKGQKGRKRNQERESHGQGNMESFQQGKENPPFIQSVRTVVHSPAARLGLRVVVRGARRRHHAAHANDSARARPGDPIVGVRVHLVRIVKVYCASGLVGDRVWLRGWLPRRTRQRVRHMLVPSGEIRHRRTRAHRSTVRGILWTGAGIIHASMVVVGIESRLLVVVRLEWLRMNGPIGNLRKWSSRGLARWTRGSRVLSGTRDGTRDLMVEWLFLLGLWQIERECGGAFNIGHGDGFLGTRLMHGNRCRTTFTVGGVKRLHRWWHRRRTRRHHGHRRPWRRNTNWRTWRRGQTNNRLAHFGGNHSWSRVNRPRGGWISILGCRHSK